MRITIRYNHRLLVAEDEARYIIVESILINSIGEINMNGNCPLISVIIPVYNTEKYLPRCLDSLVGQSYPNIEIIVVNNASSGDVEKIFEDYKNLYSNRMWTIINHQKNQGLFKARISGVEVSSGEFIAFIDSDDRISFDYYRLLINKAMKEKADMVAAETWYENSKGELFKFNLSSLEMFSDKVETDDLLKLMYSCEGKCYSFHLVWNKIYSRSLWKKAYPFLKKIDRHIVMCEDYVFSTIFYAFAKSMFVVHNAHHYYYKGEEAYTSISASYDKVEKNIADLGIVFSETKKFLIEIGRYEELKENHIEFQKRYYRFWVRNINIAKLNLIEKRKLRKKLDLALPRDLRELSEVDTYNTSLSTNVYDYLDDIKKDICKDSTLYVSFDIFDTLIVRPLLSPKDIFQLLDIQVKELYPDIKFDIARIRITAEKSLREKLSLKSSNIEEITINDIYKEIQTICNFDDLIISEIMHKEIEIELELCMQRETGYELFQLAREYHKKILLISDMYLPTDVLQEMLVKCNYIGEYKIFVSSQTGVTKHSGEMYKYVIQELQIRQTSSMIHIGDNLNSDVAKAVQYGINAKHLPNPVEVMKGCYPNLYNGAMYTQSFLSDDGGRKDYALKFLGIRCMLGIVSNKLFDNPFCNFNRISYFDASPYIIGYAALGMHFLGVSKWLFEKAGDYNNIQFIARDGYYIMECYKMLYPYKSASYLYVSRKSLIPLLIHESDSYLSLMSILKYSSMSPKKVEKLVSNLLPAEANIEILCKKNNFIYGKNFQTENQLYHFLKLMDKNLYIPEIIDKEVEKIKKYLSIKIGPNEATFDIGYSGRTERLIGDLLKTHLNGFYIHLNDDSAIKTARKNNFHIDCYYSHTPLVAGALRELLLSEDSPSCIGYMINERGDVVPRFEEYISHFPEKLILNHFRKGALDFVFDFSTHFGKYIEKLPFREQDASIIFEFFLNKASVFDRWIFKCFGFEDDLFMGSEIALFDFWNMQTSTNNILQMSNVFDNFPVWKKVIILTITDRKLLKEKIKNRYSNHPIFLKILGIGYSIPRGIYHLFKK